MGVKRNRRERNREKEEGAWREKRGQCPGQRIGLGREEEEGGAKEEGRRKREERRKEREIHIYLNHADVVSSIADRQTNFFGALLDQRHDLGFLEGLCAANNHRGTVFSDFLEKIINGERSEEQTEREIFLKKTPKNVPKVLLGILRGQK
jgi:hypothetical protein